MNRNDPRYILGISIILLAIVACVLPGQVTQITPATNPNTIETAVVGTAQAAAEQTAAAQSAATETPGDMTGTNIEQLSDGTTKYTDYDAGFEITFPVGWLAVRPDTEEFNMALEKDGAVNSMLRDQMTSDISTYEVNFDRLYSYILRPEIQKNVIFGFSEVTWDLGDTASIDSVNMGNTVRYLESQGPFPGFRVDNAQLHEDGSTKMMEVGGHWTMTNAQGNAVPYYSLFFVFKPLPDSTVGVNFTFFQDYKVQVSEDVKSIIDSIKLIEQ